MEPTTEKWKKEKVHSKSSELSVDSLGICGVSPEEERKAMVGRIRRKWRF